LPESVREEDLVSAGVVGLIAAIDNFDPRQNVKLRTYAEYKIRGAILDSLRGLDWASRDLRRKAKQIEAAIADAEQKAGRAATEEEIASELGLGLEEYREWLMDIRGLTLNSLEYSSHNEDSRNLLEILPDSEQNWPSHLAEVSELDRLLADAIEKIPPVERTVLGLYYQGELTLREIAGEMNLHLSRISQLKSQAILRLRAYINKRWPIARGR
jgi:RNA polymerase sigma factor for flagellar operon FliA